MAKRGVSTIGAVIILLLGLLGIVVAEESSNRVVEAPVAVELPTANNEFFRTTQLILFHLDHYCHSDHDNNNTTSLEKAYHFVEGWYDKFIQDQIVGSNDDNGLMTNHPTGYWEPHTSSVVFCERDYLHSNYIVEFHNTWSSLLGVSYFGYLGLRYGNPTNEVMFQVYFTILLVIGIGSACLHGTMHHVFQASDELPMIYVFLSGWYICVNVTTTKTTQHHSSWLAYSVVAMAIGNTIIYYAFQQWFLVFMITSHIMGDSACFFGLYLCIKRWHIPAIRYLGVLVLPCIFVIGFTAWFLDMLLCKDVCLPIADSLPSLLQGITPHILWHFCAGYFAYTGIMCMVLIRLEHLKLQYTVQWYMGGLLPVPVLLLENV